MSDELILRLRALAARPDDVSEVGCLWKLYAASCEAGDLLLAENERLRAENEKLREEVEYLRKAHQTAIEWANLYRADNIRMRYEIERMKEDGR
jgi:regulator of replication initiation timing